MQRQYTEYCKRTTKSKNLIGVTCSDIEYSSFSMGAGEQRIFLILEKIIKAPRYSLILIDEIDLLLHEDALSRLLDELNNICNDRNLQLIFTTHSRSILSKDYIAFRNLYQTQEKTLCLEKSYPQFLTRLSGQRVKMYEIFVEDELARTIVEQLCIDNGVKPNVDIIKFGPAIVGVHSACGMVVTDFNNMDRSLFVTDGDKVHFDDDWYNKRVNKYFEGDDPDLNPKMEMALKLITRFNMPNNQVAPEEYYRNCILGLNRESLNEGEKTIYDALQNVVMPADTHDYFKTAIENLGLSLETGTWEIIKLLKKTGQWGQITERVQQWIDSIKPNIVIPEINNERQLPN
ncbi:MAG: ATP-binding protein [Bacteroidales bacterium]|nr:ATP-binding protein [Bacteroidales bacterium]